MNTMLTCAACDHTGYDVLLRVVELEPTSTIRVQGNAGVYTVPERYGTEPRCIDREACESRQEGTA